MPTGDTLQVIGLAIGAVLAALNTTGWRAGVCWAFAGFLALLSFVYAGILPSLGVQLSDVTPIVNALLAPAVIGAVVLLIREKRQPELKPDLPIKVEPNPEPTLPSFAAGRTHLSGWKPDISFTDAMVYLGRDSTWGNPNRAGKEVKDKLVHALQGAKVIAWGKAHPDDAESYQISQTFWVGAEPTLETNYIYSSNRTVGAYDVQLSKAQLSQVWPPKNDPRKIT